MKKINLPIIILIITALFFSFPGFEMPVRAEGSDSAILIDSQSNIYVRQGVNQPAWIIQLGQSNFTLQLLTGWQNRAVVFQKGSSNFIWQRQTGNSNYSRVTQQGTNNTAVINQSKDD